MYLPSALIKHGFHNDDDACEAEGVNCIGYVVRIAEIIWIIAFIIIQGTCIL